MQTSSLILRSFHAAAFVFASLHNWSAFIESFPTQGFRIAGASTASTVYFHSLLAIDPIVVTLLLIRPRTGLVTAGVVLATNIVHNMWFLRSISMPIDMTYWLTLGFLIFFLATAVFAWRGLRHISHFEPNHAVQRTSATPPSLT